MSAALTVKQLTLPAQLKDVATFANYFTDKNQQLVQALQQVVTIGRSEIIYLYGNTNRFGRSHLSQATCHYAQTLGLSAMYLPLAQFITADPALLLNLENIPLVCVDDLQLLAINKSWEEAFLYFYCRTMANNGRLIISANFLPKSLKLTLPDLSSRLMSAATYQLAMLNDDDKLLILLQRAAIRGMILPNAVAHFILTHSNRSMTTILAALDAMEHETLRRQRKLTIPLVKEILNFS
jgi:DnaA family protein